MGSSPSAAYPVSIGLPVAESVMPVYRQLCLGLLSQLLTHEFNNSLTSLSGYAQMALSLRKEEIYLEVRPGVPGRVQPPAGADPAHPHPLPPAPERDAPVRPQPGGSPGAEDPGPPPAEEEHPTPDIQPARPHRSGNLAVLSLGMLTYVLDARDRILQEGPAGLDPASAGGGRRCGAQIRMGDSSTLPCRLADPAPEAGLCWRPTPIRARRWLRWLSGPWPTSTPAASTS